MTSKSFHQSEENFVYSCIVDIVNVWTRGTGLASFSIDVEDGSAKIDMSFSLGHPSDVHVLPSSSQVDTKNRRGKALPAEGETESV